MKNLNLPEFKLKSISSNTNTVLNAIDYKKDSDILAFAASNIIHIYSISKVKTFLTSSADGLAFPDKTQRQ